MSPYRPVGTRPPGRSQNDVSADYARFDACVRCRKAAGVPCVNLENGQAMSRPHAERVLRVDRTVDGVMVLGRLEHVRWSRRGTTDGAQAHHAGIGGVSACMGAALTEGTYRPLPDLNVLERCQRSACKRLWKAEAYR